MKDETLKSLFAMACVTALSGFALLNGIDGVLFTAVIGALSGLGGYAFAKRQTG